MVISGLMLEEILILSFHMNDFSPLKKEERILA